MYYVLCAIVLFWQLIHSYFYGTMYEPIFYILYFYADMVAYDKIILYTLKYFLPMSSF